MITTLIPAQESTERPPAILSLIGETPLVEITQFDTGPCQLFLKLENQNPTGSIKDRIALSMIEAAEAEGAIEPGQDAHRAAPRPRPKSELYRRALGETRKLGARAVNLAKAWPGGGKLQARLSLLGFAFLSGA